MKKYDHFFTIVIGVIVVMVFSNAAVVSAQRASAEFISAMGPVMLKSGQDVKDGIQNLTYRNNILYVINIWAGIQVIDVTTREKPREIGNYPNQHRAHNLFIDDHYVDKEVYNAHVTSNAQDLQQMDEKTALLFQAMKDQNDQEFNRIYKAIKDGTALPLIVRRDILLARGDNLSSEERAELAILETKLDELNIE